MRTRTVCPCLDLCRLNVQVHQRLKGYVKTHFEHNLKCVEKGLIDPYNA